MMKLLMELVFPFFLGLAAICCSILIAGFTIILIKEAIEEW